MTRTYWIFIFFCFANNIIAQLDMYNTGEMFIATETEVYINGGLSNETEEFENQGTIELTGNFSNKANVNFPFSGKMILSGNTIQLVELLAPFTTEDLIINNGSRISFIGNQHLNIDGLVEFDNGIVYTTNQSSLFFNDGAFSIGASDITYINGPCYKKGIDQFVFPIGKNGRYRAMSIDDVDSPSIFRGTYFDNRYSILQNDESLEEVSDLEYWELERIEGVSGAKLTLTHDDNSFYNPDDVTDVQIAYFAQENWKEVNSVYELEEQLPLSFSSKDKVYSFGNFTFGTKSSSVHLRDNIIDFSILRESCNMILNWSTFERINSIYRYDIYRQKNAEAFELISSINALNTSIFNDYDYIDSEVEQNNIYTYKIVAVSYNEEEIHSIENQVKSSCDPISVNLLPNPVLAGDPLVLLLNSNINKEDFKILIVDNWGRILQEHELQIIIGENKVVFDTYKFSESEYYVWFPKSKYLESIPFQVIYR